MNESKAVHLSLGDHGPQGRNLAHEFDYRRLLSRFGPEVVHGNPVMQNALRMIRSGGNVEEVLVETVKALTIMNRAILQVTHKAQDHIEALEAQVDGLRLPGPRESGDNGPDPQPEDECTMCGLDGGDHEVGCADDDENGEGDA